MMDSAMRRTGIDVIGSVPWGTHFCQFYETSQDLIDILVPYFKDGLESGEFCMWVTSEPLKVDQAMAALIAAVPDLDDYIDKGQIEILDYSQWYTRTGKFSADEVLHGWVDKLTEAQKQGFEGLRLTGNTFWLEKADWDDFTRYEETVNDVIGRYKMLAICTYSLQKCNVLEILDVVANHQFALIKRSGRWEIIESDQHKKTEQALRESEERLSALYNSMVEGVALHEIVYDSAGNPADYIITDVNPSYEKITGLSRDYALGKRASALYGTNEPPYLDVYARVASSGRPVSFETYFEPMKKHFSISVFSPAKGKFATVFSDITERKLMEEALQEKQEELEAQSEELEAQNEELRAGNDALAEAIRKLQESEAHYKSLAENMPSVLMRYDRDLRVVYLSPQAEKITGIPTEQFVGKTNREVGMPKDLCDIWEAAIRQVLQTGANQDLEFEFPVADGCSSKAFYLKLAPEFSSDGSTVQHVLGISTDITERKRQEEKIAKLTRLYAVLSQVNEAIVRIHDEESLYSEICRIVAEVGGFPLVWIGQINEHEVIPVAWSGPAADYLKEIKVEVQGKLGKGPTGTCIRVNRAVVNDDFTANPATSPWREPAQRYGFRASAAFPLHRHGKAIGAFTLYASEPNAFDTEQVGLLESLNSDISYALDVLDQEQLRIRAEEELRKSRDELELRVRERTSELSFAKEELEIINEELQVELEQHRKLEAELVKAKETAEAAVDAKAAFLANMSHELRTPMNAVIGMTGILLEENLLPEQKEYLEIIRNGGESMMTLISDLLDFTRVEKEKVSLEYQPFSLRACVEESLGQVSAQADKRGLDLAYTIKYGAPDAFIGDPGRLRQVLVNLLSNAVKFTDEGEVSISISSKAVGETKHQLHFAVKDTGIGIPQEKMDQLFLPFSQVETTISRKRDGAGLGLAICKGLVELMGGSIWAKSEVGNGSIFYFTIEAEVAKDLPTRSEVLDKSIGNLAEQHPLRILVAEDNPSNQRVLIEMLKGMGYRADAVADGREVIEALGRRPYDLILMDVRMPEMDGLKATKEIRRIWPEDGPKIIAITAYALAGDREKCLAAGMDGYIPKPVQKEDLAKALVDISALFASKEGAT